MKRTLRRKQQAGVALLTVLFALMLLSCIGLAMMYATNTETYINANFKDKQIANYAAMGGLQEARDRIQPVNAVAPITAPNALPLNNNNAVIYIVNPRGSENVRPWQTSNDYFDTELCHENVLSLTGTAGVPCTTIANGSAWRNSVDDSSSSNAPWNLTTPTMHKWTRIQLKGNNNTPIPVDGNAGNATQVCWNGTQQVTLPATYVGTDCGPGHSVLTVTLTNAGSGYTAAPTITIASPGGSGTQATATANFNPVPNGQVGAINITSGGSGYTSNPNVNITGGGGSGATATASIYNPGAPVASVTLTSAHGAGEQCYASAPTITFSGGGGSGASATANLGSTDCIVSMSLSANCAKNDTLTVTVTGGGGNTFTAAALYSGSGSGNSFSSVSTGPFSSPVNVPITSPGTNYNGSAITVAVNGTKPQSQPCTNVTATPVFGKRVTSLSFNSATQGGASYQTAPTMAFSSSGGTGTLPTATDTLGTPPPNAQTVTSITVTASGSGYSTAPTVNITGGGGTGATATASIANTAQLTGVTVVSGGSGYTTIPTVTITPNPPSGPGTGATAVASVDGVSGLTYGMVYLLTSLAVTPSGARSMMQMEVATPVRGVALTGALTLDGPSPVVDQLPNSSPFYIDGADYAATTSHPATGNAVPQPPTCNNTPGATHPAIGVYDDPNASPPTNSISNVTSQIPSGRTNNYLGSGPSPDVENIFGALGDTMTNPAGLLAFSQAVRAAPGTNIYTTNPGSIALGSQNVPAIDYVNGDITLNGTNTGYGILLVTGSVTMGGNFSWNGLVLVIGDGNISFGGGGNGQINGSVIVAKIWDGWQTQNLLSTMGSPTMHWNGGGGNGIYYDHCWAEDMLNKIPFLPPPPAKQLKVLSTRTLSY